MRLGTAFIAFWSDLPASQRWWHRIALSISAQWTRSSWSHAECVSGIAIVLAARGRKHVWAISSRGVRSPPSPGRASCTACYSRLPRDTEERRGPIRHHPNGGRLVHAQPLAQRLVGLHLIGELALRIDHKGQRDAVLLRELLCKRAQIVLSLDTDLVREDVVAIFVAELWAACRTTAHLLPPENSRRASTKENRASARECGIWPPHP